jgi:3-phenylpropionate/trans-cinnamate dioxygenase ferredoxin reductase subunit
MVIVGAGECGARAAFALREFGFGGPVTLIGSEPLHPYERPPLSKDALTEDATPSPKWVSMAERFAEREIICLTGTSAVALDRQTKTIRLSDGSSLDYDKLLLATGASPRLLPMAETIASRARLPAHI